MASVGFLCGERMKNKLMWFYYSWDSIMNLKYNPIGYIREPSLQAYFMTALSIIWTLVFCTYIAGWLNVMPLIVGHVLFIFATFFTYAVFEDAKRDGKAWFQNWDEKYTLSRAFRNRNKEKNACRWDLEIEA